MQYFSGHSIFRGKFRYAEIYCAFVHNCAIEMKCAQVGVCHQKSGKVMSTNNSRLSFHILLDQSLLSPLRLRLRKKVECWATAFTRSEDIHSPLATTLVLSLRCVAYFLLLYIHLFAFSVPSLSLRDRTFFLLAACSPIFFFLFRGRPV